MLSFSGPIISVEPALESDLEPFSKLKRFVMKSAVSPSLRTLQPHSTYRKYLSPPVTAGFKHPPVCAFGASQISSPATASAQFARNDESLGHQWASYEDGLHSVDQPSKSQN